MRSELFNRVKIKILMKLKKRADQWTENIKQIDKKKIGKFNSKKLKYKCITYKLDLLATLIEWYRLYKMHKSGLYYYCDHKRLLRSILELEQLCSLKSGHFRKCSGNSQVGNLTKTKEGEYCQIIIYYSQDRIFTILPKLEKSYLKISTKRFRERQLKNLSYRYYRKEKYSLTNILIRNL